MRALKRFANAMHMPIEQAEVTVEALRSAFEIRGKRRHRTRVAALLAAIVTKTSTTQYNTNDVAYARDWIAKLPTKRSTGSAKTLQRANSKGKMTVLDD